jgi:hypothetical protein
MVVEDSSSGAFDVLVEQSGDLYGVLQGSIAQLKRDKSIAQHCQGWTINQLGPNECGSVSVF